MLLTLLTHLLVLLSGASVTHGPTGQAAYAPLVMNHARNRDELANYAQVFP